MPTTIIRSVHDRAVRVIIN